MPIAPETKVHRRATADEFQQACANATVVVEKRDFFDRGAPPNTDPQFDKPAHKYLATRFDLYQMEEGEVGEPQLARDKSAAYIVRVAGRRQVPIDRMTPAQYERYKTNARDQAIDEMAIKFDLAFLEKNYGLVLRKPQEEEGGKTAANGSKTEEASAPKAESSPPAQTPSVPAEPPSTPTDPAAGEETPRTEEPPAETPDQGGEAEAPK